MLLFSSPALPQSQIPIKAVVWKDHPFGTSPELELRMAADVSAFGP